MSIIDPIITTKPEENIHTEKSQLQARLSLLADLKQNLSARRETIQHDLNVVRQVSNFVTPGPRVADCTIGQLDVFPIDFPNSKSQVDRPAEQPVVSYASDNQTQLSIVDVWESMVNIQAAQAQNELAATVPRPHIEFKNPYV